MMSTAEEKRPTEEIRQPDFPEENQGSARTASTTCQNNIANSETIKESRGDIGGLSSREMLLAGLSIEPGARGDKEAEPRSPSSRSK
jgi:hypothetical protein